MTVDTSCGNVYLSGRYITVDTLFSLLFHAGQAAIKLPSAEASKRAASPGQYTPYIKGIMETL